MDNLDNVDTGDNVDYLDNVDHVGQPQRQPTRQPKRQPKIQQKRQPDRLFDKFQDVSRQDDYKKDEDFAKGPSRMLIIFLENFQNFQDF